MKKFKFITLAIAILGFTSISFAQIQTTTAVTAVAKTFANIITPLSIVNDADLNFGNIAPSATTDGTVVITPAGVRTSTGVSLPTSTGTVSPAQFTVTGEGTSTFSISMPSTLTLTSGSNSMLLSAINHDAGAAPALAGGTKVFHIGATLTVPAAQASGLYKNETEFIVTVNYN